MNKKIIVIIALCLLIIVFYLFGRFQGEFKTNVEHYQADCEDSIYPYGCKMDTNATHCIVFDCMVLGGQKNTAICFEVDEVNETKYDVTWKDKVVINGLASLLYGCPARLETIGINSITGNENWKYNKISDE